MIQEKFIAEVVDTLIPQLNYPSLGILVTVFGPGNQAISMHHSNIQ
jgi:hypothetical protein